MAQLQLLLKVRWSGGQHKQKQTVNTLEEHKDSVIGVAGVPTASSSAIIWGSKWKQAGNLTRIVRTNPNGLKVTDGFLQDNGWNKGPAGWLETISAGDGAYKMQRHGQKQWRLLRWTGTLIKTRSLFCFYPHVNEVHQLSYLQYLLNLEQCKNYTCIFKVTYKKIGST